MLSFDASDRSYPVCSDGRCLPLGCLCEIRLISCVCGGSIFKYSLTGSLLRSLCLSAHDQKPTGVAAGKGVSAPNMVLCVETILRLARSRMYVGARTFKLRRCILL